MKAVLTFHVNRNLGEGVFPFTEVFTGVEHSPALGEIFDGPATTHEVLRDMRVCLVDSMWYMWINDEDGSLMISLDYLREADDRTLYLDVVHELTHVRQFRDGRELFDESYGYVDRPTEIEAYRITVREARRLGMSDREIYEYLKVEWVSEDDVKRLATTLGVEPQ